MSDRKKSLVAVAPISIRPSSRSARASAHRAQTATAKNENLAAILALPRMGSHSYLVTNQWEAFDVGVYGPKGPECDLHSHLLLAFRDVTGAWEISVLERYTGLRREPELVGFEASETPVYYVARTPEDVARIVADLEARYSVDALGLRDLYEEWLEQQEEKDDSPGLRLAA